MEVLDAALSTPSGVAAATAERPVSGTTKVVVADIDKVYEKKAERAAESMKRQIAHKIACKTIPPHSDSENEKENKSSNEDSSGSDGDGVPETEDDEGQGASPGASPVTARKKLFLPPHLEKRGPKQRKLKRKRKGKGSSSPPSKKERKKRKQKQKHERKKQKRKDKGSKKEPSIASSYHASNLKAAADRRAEKARAFKPADAKAPPSTPPAAVVKRAKEFASSVADYIADLTVFGRKVDEVLAKGKAFASSIADPVGTSRNARTGRISTADFELNTRAEYDNLKSLASFGELPTLPGHPTDGDPPVDLSGEQVVFTATATASRVTDEFVDEREAKGNGKKRKGKSAVRSSSNPMHRPDTNWSDEGGSPKVPSGDKLQRFVKCTKEDLELFNQLPGVKARYLKKKNGDRGTKAAIVFVTREAFDTFFKSMPETVRIMQQHRGLFREGKTTDFNLTLQPSNIYLIPRAQSQELTVDAATGKAVGINYDVYDARIAKNMREQLGNLTAKFEDTSKYRSVSEGMQAYFAKRYKDSHYNTGRLKNWYSKDELKGLGKKVYKLMTSFTAFIERYYVPEEANDSGAGRGNKRQKVNPKIKSAVQIGSGDEKSDSEDESMAQHGRPHHIIFKDNAKAKKKKAVKRKRGVPDIDTQPAGAADDSGSDTDDGSVTETSEVFSDEDEDDDESEDESEDEEEDEDDVETDDDESETENESDDEEESDDEDEE